MQRSRVCAGSMPFVYVHIVAPALAAVIGRVPCHLERVLAPVTNARARREPPVA